jgi:pantoate--beta-alanine ligase
VGFKKDYVRIVNASTFMPASKEDTDIVILIAAFMGTTRLIDNLQIRI